MTSLEETLAALARGLDTASVPYMIVGSLAAGIHGIARVAQGLDLVIDPDLDGLRDLLAILDRPSYWFASGPVPRAKDALVARATLELVDLETSWRISLVLRRLRAFSRAELARRRPIVIGALATFVASPEDTILAALERAQQRGGSERLLRDCADIVGVQGEALDRGYIETWAAELGVEAEWARVRGG